MERPFSAHAAGPSVGDYGLIGDGRTAALVARDGSVEWLCLPDFSSPSLFAAILDPERGGRLALRPTEPFRVERRYIDDTAVLETVFFTRTGSARLVDLLPLPRGRAQLEPRRELLRLLEGLGGKIAFELVFEPRPDFGRSAFTLQPRTPRSVACKYRNEIAFLSTDAAPIAATARSATARFTLHARERRAVSLAFASHAPAVLPVLGEPAWARADDTEEWWREWSGRCRYAGPHRRMVMRSLITLRLLTSSLSGAVIAAPTTSLPENPGGSRNWDYRYCWLRDASRTLEAFDFMGYRLEAESFLGWLLHATRLTRPELQVLYSVYGEARIPEQLLPHFSGFAGSRPVRLGNDAWRQLQLDIYGEVVEGAYAYVMGGGRLDPWEQQYLGGYGDVVCRRWREPDNGMWEIRGARRHYTFSKLMCWVVLHRLLKLHERGHLRINAVRYRREMDSIRQAIENHGFSRRLNSYVGAFGAEWLDASLMLMPHHGYLPGHDPRMLGTYARLHAELGQGSLYYRYPPGSDHLQEPEGMFAACSFWAIDCLAHAGRLDEAERELDHLISLANDLGLYGEEFAADGTPLGNFPQAFTHSGLVTAAIALDRAHRGILPWQ